MRKSNAGKSAPRKPTMSDVARLAGVGTMTVSRVLNSSANVSEETASRVRKAIEQLHYRPNELARALRAQRSHTIGLIVPYLYDPFFADSAHAISVVARQKGYSVILTTSDEDPEIEYNEAQYLLQRGIEGLILLPANRGQSRLNRGIFGKTPVVAFDRPLSDPAIDTVLVQNQSGARRMVQHLIEHGHKRIAFVGLSRALFTINARYSGYRRAMLDAGLEPDPYPTCDTEEQTEDLVRSRMAGSDAPTAFFTSNTLSTRYLLIVLTRLGIRVPQHVALGCFDDFEMAELAASPLSVVRQPAQEIGRVAADQLFTRIERGEIPKSGNRIVLPVELVLRRSCGCRHRTPVIV